MQLTLTKLPKPQKDPLVIAVNSAASRQLDANTKVRMLAPVRRQFVDHRGKAMEGARGRGPMRSVGKIK
jgi:hypothetical protein